MAGLNETMKNIKGNAKGLLAPKPTAKGWSQSLGNPLKTLEFAAENLSSTFTPSVPEIEEDTIFAMPAESKATLEAERRRLKLQGGGRASTIMTEGLGG